MTDNNDNNNNNEIEDEFRDNPWITVYSEEDGSEFQLRRAAAGWCDLLVASLGLDDEEEAHDDRETKYDKVPIRKVRGAVLEKVIEFLQHYSLDPYGDIALPLEGDSFEEIITDQWYHTYINESTSDMMFEILSASNYLGIKPLLDLTCLWCTFELAGKTADEIREILNMPELTPEEEREARANHPWIFNEINDTNNN